ncbi:ATP-grasp domain-containing protein [Leptospira gomenensis]|uniref:ATP-grasp domain-containing protein n=1 Tax=Leptospira gomenensis TaxID=2484974 RepID=A0A5F1YEP3_9LEPT|nr:ATP-grasp domain-containing protein [Leptospira gomenensis]TGK37598.1 ATP-grasp domain-containing protein [Leptospira gomenensis]TGK39393.1 ATP-grasp domain-containing protein [Leptospira gomenensis]TGK43183.1 ATP-grasp domain-containing protein [Leptospira gomenensis]TGK54988.1 ATP-grasp domain-containing protein [Leptospira gomenensis]
MKQTGYFISIGAGINQVPLIKAAIRLGYSVIAVDQNDKAPGLALASLRIMESVTEYRKILKILSEIPMQGTIVGIGTRSYGKATYTASYIADKLKLRYAPLASVEICSDKNLLKKAASDAGILVPQGYDPKAGISKNQFPFVYKPSGGSAKEGIRTFHEQEEWELFLKTRKKNARVKTGNTGRKTSLPEREEWIAEEYVPGFEITVCGLVQNGNFFPASISHKDVTSYDPYLETAHTLPFQNRELVGEILLNCRAITAAARMNQCPFVAEFRITPQGEIYLIEAAPEVGGEFLADYLLPEYFGSDYFENLVKLLVGDTVLPFKNYVSVPKKFGGIFFSAPPRGKSKLTRYAEFQTDGKEKLLFDNKRKELGEVLRVSEGNSARVRSVGILGPAANDQTPEEWKRSVLKRLESEFESL